MHNLVYCLHFAFTIAALGAIFWLAQKQKLPAGLRPGRDLPLWAFIAVVIVGVGFVYVGFQASSPPAPIWDFLNAYYPAGQAALHHDPAMLRALIGRETTGGFVNLPVVAYLFAPLALFPPKIAAILFTLVGLGLTVLAWFMLVRLAKLEVRERWLLALLFMANGPLLTGIKFGNLSYYVIFAFAAALMLLKTGRNGWAGALLGLVAVIKPPLVLFGLFFLFRRDIRGTASFAAVGISSALLSLAIYGWADNLYWFQTCIVQYSHHWLATFSVQSIPAFILRLQSDARISEWLPQVPTSGEELAAHILDALIFIGAAVACLRLPSNKADPIDVDGRRNLQFMLVICLCLVSSPLVWSHYYAWLLVPVAFFLGAQPTFPVSKIARTVGWVAIVLTTPLNGWPTAISNPVVMAMYRSVFMSHMLIGGLLWFGLVAWWLSSSGGLLSRLAAKKL